MSTLQTATASGWVRWFGTWEELQSAGLVPAHIEQPEGWTPTEWAAPGYDLAAWRYRRPGAQLPAQVLADRDHWLVQASPAAGRGQGLPDADNLCPDAIRAALARAPRALGLVHGSRAPF